MDTPRWRAVITYHSQSGPVDVTHEIEELDEIADLVERGPDWNCIADIRITLSQPIVEGMTLEEADQVGQMAGPEWDAWLAARRQT